MIFDQYCIKKLVPRPKLSEKFIRGFSVMTETVKKWLESSQNRSIAQKGLFFFFLTPGIDLSNNFGIGKCFCYIGCVFLSDI